MPGGTFVYVSNADSKDIRVLKLDAAGALSEVHSVTLSANGPLGPLAVSPDRRFLYAAQRAEPWTVSAFTIDGLTGELSLLGTAPLMHSTPYIITDRTGRWLFAASYQGSVLSISAIGPHGFPMPPHQVVRTEQNAHSVQIDAANKHVYVPCLGGDVFLSWDFDDVTGTIDTASLRTNRVQKGAGPRHFVLHPDNRHVYLLNELQSSVYAYAYDPRTGALNELQTQSALPPDFAGPPFGEPGVSTNGGPKAADLHVTPDGRFLYASERTSSSLNAFSVDLTSGRPDADRQLRDGADAPGVQHRPDGPLSAGGGSGLAHLTTYAIDPATGALSSLERYEMGTAPNWVEIHRLP